VLFIDAIRPALESLGPSDIEIATTGDEALEAVRRSSPDLVLIDLGLPDRSGLSVGRDIIEFSPQTKVVALTAFDDTASVREALRLGFRAYITKETPVAQFLSSIRAVIDGQSVITPRLATALGVRRAPARATDLLIDQLTTREREVLALLVEGLSGPMIAHRLSISTHTVRTHIQSILTKLQVHSRLEAAAFAVRHGIVVPRARAYP
jgi:two-component system nitrate/nitrite response regulator NarL